MLKRERFVILIALAIITALAWLYLLKLSRTMNAMSMAGTVMPMSMPGPIFAAWSPADFLLTFVMWAAMMIGMMVPSAAPMVLTFAAVNRVRAGRGGPYVPTGAFLSGYLGVWAAFSVVATMLEWALHQAALLDLGAQRAVPWVGGLLLIAAGVFQFTPLKTTCLARCRSPLDFLTDHWHEGRAGALRMGLEHGLFCVGCCWMLMLLLFVAGVMNLVWVAVIAAFVLAEKVVPGGRPVTVAGALACVLAGLLWLARATP